MVHGIWYMMYGVWCMVSGVWCMVYGVWCMVYGVSLGRPAVRLARRGRRGRRTPNGYMVAVTIQRMSKCREWQDSSE
jgi:hypothetical protein